LRQDSDSQSSVKAKKCLLTSQNFQYQLLVPLANIQCFSSEAPLFFLLCSKK
jgi:hypothetical protein